MWFQVCSRESVRSDVSSNDQRDAGERLRALSSSPALSFHGIRASGSARYRSSCQRSVISFLSSMETKNIAFHSCVILIMLHLSLIYGWRLKSSHIRSGSHTGPSQTTLSRPWRTLWEWMGTPSAGMWGWSERCNHLTNTRLLLKQKDIGSYLWSWDHRWLNSFWNLRSLMNQGI